MGCLQSDILESVVVLFQEQCAIATRLLQTSVATLRSFYCLIWRSENRKTSTLLLLSCFVVLGTDRGPTDRIQHIKSTYATQICYRQGAFHMGSSNILRILALTRSVPTTCVTRVVPKKKSLMQIAHPCSKKKNSSHGRFNPRFLIETSHERSGREKVTSATRISSRDPTSKAAITRPATKTLLPDSVLA